MTIRHEAFLDLEQSLATRFNNAWAKEGTRITKEIEKHVEKGEFDRAHELVDEIDLGPVAERQRKYLETIGMSALLLGASRVRPPRQSQIYKSPPKEQLRAATTQSQVMISRNATQALREEAHLMLYTMEYAIEKQETVIKSEVRTTIRASAKAYVDLMAGLHVSRLNSAGFLMEAYDAGIDLYAVSSILDELACEVCKSIHGKVFRIEEGVSHIQNVLMVDDPDALRTIAPWPKQNKSAVKALTEMSVSQLAAQGYHVPPYHPACRCILVPAGTVQPRAESEVSIGVDYFEPTEVVNAPEDERIGVASMALYGSSSTSERSLFNRLLGDRSDIAEAASNFSLVSGFGIGLLLGLQQDEVVETNEKPKNTSTLEQILDEL